MSSPGHLVKILFPLLLISVTGCYTPPKPRQPALIHDAQRRNLAGIDAEERGQMASAKAEFNEAYSLFAAVENYHGMATVLINSSRLFQAEGDHEKAAAYLKQVQTLIPHVPELESEICFESARFAILRKDGAGALNWAKRGVISATEPDRGRMYNLLAGVYLKNGDISQGREAAESALKVAKSYVNRREEANAMRLLGEAAFQDKNYRESIISYEAALQIDKELALAPRVFADLSALSLAAEAAGNTAIAADYLQRAVDAAFAGKKISVATAELDRLVSLYNRSGRGDLAEQAARLKKSLIIKRSP